MFHYPCESSTRRGSAESEEQDRSLVANCTQCWRSMSLVVYGSWSGWPTAECESASPSTWWEWQPGFHSKFASCTSEQRVDLCLENVWIAMVNSQQQGQRSMSCMQCTCIYLVFTEENTTTAVCRLSPPPSKLRLCPCSLAPRFRLIGQQRQSVHNFIVWNIHIKFS